MATSSYASFSGFKDKSTKNVKPKTFKQAFADARKSGKKTFSFDGKKFTTQTKDDIKSAGKNIKLGSTKNIDPDDLGGKSSGMAGTPGGKSVSEKDRLKSAVDRKDSDTISRLTKRKISKIKGMKAGGSVKAKKKKRIDGIAKKGKTKGRII